MALSNASKAGAAIFVGTVQFSICLILSEVYYPGYNVSANYISDLGATCNSGLCVIYQPSSMIFNTSIVVLGLLVLLAAYYLQKAFEWTPGTIVVVLSGLGALGVGLFNETTGVWHEIFSLVTFLFAGLSAILLARFQRRPMSYFSVALGLLSLAALVLFIPGEYLGLGPGGMERMVVYPALLWAVGFGGGLMGGTEGKERTDPSLLPKGS